MISERLKIIIDYYQLSSSSFADSLGVQRSSLSHILNGRNKPSLDFIMKVDKTFPEVSLQWLLYNEGAFPTSKAERTPPPAKTQKSNLESDSKSISTKASKIVVFYNDGTFESFSSKE